MCPQYQDGISFKVNQDIYVHGVGLYSAKSNPEKLKLKVMFASTLESWEKNIIETVEFKEGFDVGLQKENKINPVMFSSMIKVVAGQIYTVAS